MSGLSIENYKSVKEDVSQVRYKLDKINEDKEFWFRRKEDLKTEIRGLIINVKEIKAEEDKKNIELQELKKQRNKYNDDVKQLIKRIKKLNNEKADAFKKYNVKVDPAKIQEKINNLEKKVEIEVDFEKEKKLMEEIKKLKKSYEESSEVLQIAEKANELDKEIRESRKKADDFHRKILDMTKDTKYDVFIELSKKINLLKKEQEDAFQKFIDHKNEYSDANRELRNKLEELQALNMLFNRDKEFKKLKLDERHKQIIREKSKAVEEKIKNKKKLTTEDVIAMQGLSDETSF